MSPAWGRRHSTLRLENLRHASRHHRSFGRRATLSLTNRNLFILSFTVGHQLYVSTPASCSQQLDKRDLRLNRVQKQPAATEIFYHVKATPGQEMSLHLFSWCFVRAVSWNCGDFFLNERFSIVQLLLLAHINQSDLVKAHFWWCWVTGLHSPKCWSFSVCGLVKARGLCSTVYCLSSH